MIRKIYREFYLLSRGEQRALVLISCLLILGLGTRIAVRMRPSKPPPEMAGFEQEARAILASISRRDSLDHIASLRRDSMNRGRFIPQNSQYRSRHQFPVQPEQSFININKADSADLLPLPGIGPVYAGRIIRYRNLLGGFTGIGQLSEVYGLGEETVELISGSIIIDQEAIRKLDPDSASFSQLLRHPYLQLDDVRAIVKYRDFKGRIDSIEEIVIHQLLPDSTLEKVGPYLNFRH